MPSQSAVPYRRRPSRLPDRQDPPVVGLAGVGLIGGSIGLRARAIGWRAIGWDRDPAVLSAATARGALCGTAASLPALAAAVDVLVLAGPVDATLAQLAELESGPAEVTAGLVLDVGSAKAAVARAGAGLPAFVPTHPIAGSEKSGPENARADLFDGRIWAYDTGDKPELEERVLRFIMAMGGRPFALDSREHDRLIALTSHLPQMLSVALGARLQSELGEPGIRELCGPGMQSMLRLAGSSFSMWGPLVTANARPLAQEVRALAAILQGAAEALESGATDDLSRLFAAGAAGYGAVRANDASPGGVMTNKNVS